MFDDEQDVHWQLDQIRLGIRDIAVSLRSVVMYLETLEDYKNGR